MASNKYSWKRTARTAGLAALLMAGLSSSYECGAHHASPEKATVKGNEMTVTSFNGRETVLYRQRNKEYGLEKPQTSTRKIYAKQ